MSYPRLLLALSALLLTSACVAELGPAPEPLEEDALAAEEPSDEESSDEAPSDEAPSDEAPSDEELLDEELIEEEIPDEEPIEAEPPSEEEELVDDELPVEEELSDDDEVLPDDAVPPPEDAVLAAAPEPAEEPDATDPVVRTTTLRVLSWNIAGGKEHDCAPQAIKGAVMRYVRQANKPVDFISLNEVCLSQFKAIREAIRGYWNKGDDETFAAFKSGGGSRVGNAIFSRRNLRAITKHQIGSDQYGGRYLVCGRQEGRRVRVCSVHLTPGDSKARVQLGRVKEHLERWWSERRDTVVIAGDFNLTADDHAFNAVYAQGSSTPNNPNNHGKYRELDDKDSGNCRGYGERTLPWTTGGPCGNGRKIDFIFTRANRIVDGQYSANSLDIPNDCGGVCSDHRALRGSVKVRFRVD